MKMPFVIMAITALAALSGCDSDAGNPFGGLTGSDNAGAALDARAKAVGILPGSDAIEFSGRFETRSDLGTDKFCAVKTSKARFDIGVLAVFGPESKCEARGTATVSGEKVNVALTGKDSCNFDAEFDGIELRFPGTVGAGCASYCSPRASLSGTRYFIVEQGDDNARRTLGRDFEKLCP
jgi:hypothetical protein